MLQIIFAFICILFSVDASAQAYQQGQIPAFLRNEAAQQQQYQQPQQQVQQPLSQRGGSVPAFLQQEQQQQYQMQMQQIQQQQNTSNYQSADPNSGSFTLPPAVYQPAPGDVPAFVNQQQNGDSPQEQPQKLKTNQKEDVIQINFSDEQYKSEDEVTTLNKDQATQYNTEVKQQNTEDKNPTAEIPEGSVYQGGKSREDEAAAVAATEKEKLDNAQKEKDATKATIPEPAKSATNLLRITYSKDGTELSDKDKAGLLPVIRALKGSKSKIRITALTSERELGLSANKIGLQRVIGIRNFLMKQGVDFSQTEVKVVDVEMNVEDLDYIDVDKI